MADTIHSLSELITILLAFAGGMVWVQRSIKSGQREQMTAHTKDMKSISKNFKNVRKELKKKVPIAECDRLRSACPCNQQLMKGNDK